MKKLIFVAGLAIGFVLGSRAGRGPYDRLQEAASGVAADPRVQEGVAKAKDAAVTTGQQAVDTVKDKAPDVAEAVKDKASSLKDAAQDKASDATAAAKDKAAEVKAKAASGSASGGHAHAVDTPDSDETAKGGDGEVGDKSLSS